MNKKVVKFLPHLNRSWIELLEKPLLKWDEEQCTALALEYKSQVCYPDEVNLFCVFKDFEVKDTKVVIIGLDPYIGYKQAIGKSFDVLKVLKMPPSLKNLVEECKNDTGFNMPDTTKSYLEHWSKQGVLLLNKYMSVEHGKTLSHSKYWEEFSKDVVESLNTLDNIVWVLLGNEASKLDKVITNETHKVIIAGHPSPLNRTKSFKGSKIFSRVNSFLKEPIKW